MIPIALSPEMKKLLIMHKDAIDVLIGVLYH